MNRNVTIVGGGIMGLSIAYELLQRDWQVTVLEKDKLGQAASWAGAGILLPANRVTANHPVEHLSAISNDLHAQWARQLLNETGIDNGFHTCGGLYVARTHGEIAALSGLEFQWADQQIAYEILEESQIQNLDCVQQNPGAFSGVRRAISLCDEAQVCNPHHVDALIQACRLRGATLIEDCHVVEHLRSFSGEITEVKTACGRSFQSDNYVVTAGVWTEQSVDFEPLPMVPVRGQIVMYKLPSQIFAPIIYEGSHYLVPRRDGHVLAGSTSEEAGFDCSTTEEAIEMLMEFSARQFPQLNADAKVKHWAGLRPTTFDGFPYLGRLTDTSNAWVATGHFRLGIQLSTGSAQLIANLLEGKPCDVDLNPFSPSRVV